MESICSKVAGEYTSLCALVGNDLDAKIIKTKIVDLEKLYNFIVDNFFIK
jgi:hypothetical protein